MPAIPTLRDADDFKALVTRHKEEGWKNITEEMKLFVCWYIRSGYSTHKMVEVGVPASEIEMYLSDPLVQAAIADVGEKYAEVSTFTQSGLRARVARALDMALGEIERPWYAKDGTQQFRKMVDLTAAARFLELAERYVSSDKTDDANTAAPWEDR